MVLEQMVTTLASVADTAEEKFTTHYDRYVEILVYNSDKLIMFLMH